MIIKDIMTSPVITVSEEDSVVEVAKVLSKNKLHAVPVVQGMVPVGIVSESDFFTKGAVNIYLPSYIEMMKNDASMLKRVSPNEKENMEKLIKAKTKDIMSSPCMTISEGSTIEDLVHIVREKNFKTVPVVDAEGNLVGIVSLYDVIHLV